MMFMEDAIRATIEIMSADPAKLSVRSSYNLAAMSFSPGDLARSIRNHMPDFTIEYNPDFRQEIADTWPKSIDDSMAKKDWNWQAQYDLEATTSIMLQKLKEAGTN